MAGRWQEYMVHANNTNQTYLPTNAGLGIRTNNIGRNAGTSDKCPRPATALAGIRFVATSKTFLCMPFSMTPKAAQDEDSETTVHSFTCGGLGRLLYKLRTIAFECRRLVSAGDTQLHPTEGWQ
jgi:hypothetical protein